MSALSSATRMRAPAGVRLASSDGNPASSATRHRFRRRTGFARQPAQRLLDDRHSAPSAVEAASRPAPMRSAGRCAVPSGSVTVNVLPCPGVALDRRSCRRAASPAPAPAPARCRCLRACGLRWPSTRWKRSKRRGSSLGCDADAGVADREHRASSLAPQSSRRSRPRSVNLKAFERRLRTIFSHMSRST